MNGFQNAFYRGIQLGANLYLPTWHDEHWCFQTLCLMNFVSMSYCSNLIVCIVVNLIQETICSHFMGMCMFRVNSAELCK